MNIKKILFLISFVACIINLVVAEIRKVSWDVTHFNFFYKEKYLMLKEVLTQEEMKGMLWPRTNEIQDLIGIAGEDQIGACINEIKEYLKNEWIPDDIGRHLIPLCEWVVPGRVKIDDEGRRADVFLCKYRLDNHLFQIMYGNWLIVITIKDENMSNRNEDMASFTEKMFRTFFKSEPYEKKWVKTNECGVTTGWIRFGSDEWLKFITDGYFVSFVDKKINRKEARAFPDPYTFRFGRGNNNKCFTNRLNFFELKAVGVFSNWNDSGFVLWKDEDEKKIIDGLVEKRRKRLIWPSEEEFAKYRIEVSEKRRLESEQWIRKCIRKEWLSDEIGSKLIAVSNYMGGVADMCLVNYRSGKYGVYIIDAFDKLLINISGVGRDGIQEYYGDDRDYAEWVAHIFLESDLVPLKGDISIFWEKTRESVPVGYMWHKGSDKGILVIRCYVYGDIVQYEIRKKVDVTPKWAEQKLNK